jgi:hypothetical protein
MSLNCWHCHLDATLSFLIPARHLLQLEQNLPIYPLPLPPPDAEKSFLALGLHWWQERWLLVLHKQINCRFFALLRLEDAIVSLGLSSLPEKISFTTEALAPATTILPEWQTAFPALEVQDYQKFCLGEVSVHGQSRGVIAPEAFLAWRLR